MDKQNLYAIIVAGGSGTRMNAELPKQFIPIAGIPILMHTVQNFLNYAAEVKIILVLPESQFDTWSKLCKQYNFNTPKSLTLIKGGKTRFQSVKNGLQSINDLEGIVAIHDGVRPFISRHLIHESFTVAALQGNAVVSVALKDSIRKIDGNESTAMERSQFKLIQTPQCFDLSIIKKAYESDVSANFTDDASVAEYAGEKINLIEGSYDNIKITTPEDLLLAEALFKTFKY